MHGLVQPVLLAHAALVRTEHAYKVVAPDGQKRVSGT